MSLTIDAPAPAKAAGPAFPIEAVRGAFPALRAPRSPTPP
jgi:hypothetical protein